MSQSEANRSRPIAIAPSPNGMPTPQSEDKLIMPYSCLPCSRRKVKCDKIGPECSTCRKTKAECIYQAPPPRKRKRKPEEDIHERLDRYERLLKDHNLLADDEVTERVTGEKVEGPRIVPPVLNKWASFPASGRLVSGSGKVKYVDSTLWKILRATGEDVAISDDEGSESEDISAAYASPQDSMSSTFFNVGSSPRSLLDYHPTYEHAIRIWRVYVDSVEPIIKVLHKPTALATLQRVAARPSSASRSSECLVFAVYHFAVTAMTDRDCLELLGHERSRLLAKYHDAVRYTLANADFLRSTDIQVLQAFVLYLLSVRGRLDPGLLWILSGVAIRIAQRMGLHRDGELIGLGPFDTELHRRIFWQLPQIDGMAGQLCGTGINIEPGSWDTRSPLNINDEDIWPDMKETPKEPKGATDMILYLARAELGSFYTRTKSNLAVILQSGNCKDTKLVEEAEQEIDEVENSMEMRYIRYCDPMDPVHILVALGTRAAMQSSRLRIRLPRAKAGLATEEERERLFRLAIKIMDHVIALHTNPALTKFLWHTTNFYVWDCLIWVLSELRQNSHSGETKAAWSSVTRMFEW